MISVKIKSITIVCFFLIIIFFVFPLCAKANSALIALRHWSYEALEKLTLAGLVDSADISSRPIDRMAAARAVYGAVLRIREKKVNNISNARHIEAVLLSLIKELNPELNEIAPGMFGSEKERAKIISDCISIEKKFDYGAFSEDKVYNQPNSSGRDLFDGYNASVSARGYFSLAENAGIGVMPAIYLSELDNELFLQEMYFDLSYTNLILNAGRFPLWYGPGYHGSLLLSDNCRSFDTLLLKNISPFILPGFLQNLGKCNVNIFLARLEKERTIPNPYLM